MTRSGLIPTPPRMRQAALACVLVGTFVGLYSGLETLTLGSLSEQRSHVAEDAERVAEQFKPIVDPQMMVAMQDARLAVLSGMKNERGIVLGGLAIACLVAWISATRLIRPDGLPREGVRKALVVSLLTAAALRTIDGAQWTVVSQRAAAAGAAFLNTGASTTPESVPATKALLSTVLMGWSVGQTVLIAGAMLLLGQYFRSEKVKQVVALQDDASSSD